MVKKKVAKTQTRESVPIEWNIPDTIITRFASHMIVQIIEGTEFKISFFELKPEIHLIPPQTVPNTVKADCVASVVVTADRVRKIIEVLQRQLDQYNLSKQTSK